MDLRVRGLDRPRVGNAHHMDVFQRWRELGQQLRVDSIRCSATTRSGHPTSGMSAADLMAVLVDKYFRYAGTLHAAAEATGGRIVTVEDYWPEGGLGDALLAAFADADERPRVLKLAVHNMPGSGKPAELLAAAGIDAGHIAEAARRLVGAPVTVARS